MIAGVQSSQGRLPLIGTSQALRACGDGTGSGSVCGRMAVGLRRL